MKDLSTSAMHQLSQLCGLLQAFLLSLPNQYNSTWITAKYLISQLFTVIKTKRLIITPLTKVEDKIVVESCLRGLSAFLKLAIDSEESSSREKAQKLLKEVEDFSNFFDL